MTYNKFAYIYDKLMEDAPYEQWVRYIKRICNNYQVDVKSIVDVACGTGSFAIPMAKAGYEVQGIDLSEDMLLVAQEKARENQVSVQFYQQDMRTIDGFYPTDMITIFCDSLNYLESDLDVQETFAAVYRNLKDDGLFLFDVHSVFKMQEVFAGQTFALDDGALAYIWECYEGERDFSVEHELSFFVKKEENTFERFTEFHKQQTFPIETYKAWLQQAGFTIMEITADFTELAPNEESERIFFACKK